LFYQRHDDANARLAMSRGIRERRDRGDHCVIANNTTAPVSVARRLQAAGWAVSGDVLSLATRQAVGRAGAFMHPQPLPIARSAATKPPRTSGGVEFRHWRRRHKTLTISK